MEWKEWIKKNIFQILTIIGVLLTFGYSQLVNKIQNEGLKFDTVNQKVNVINHVEKTDHLTIEKARPIFATKPELSEVKQDIREIKESQTITAQDIKEILSRLPQKKE